MAQRGARLAGPRAPCVRKLHGEACLLVEGRELIAWPPPVQCVCACSPSRQPSASTSAAGTTPHPHPEEPKACRARRCGGRGDQLSPKGRGGVAGRGGACPGRGV